MTGLNADRLIDEAGVDLEDDGWCEGLDRFIDAANTEARLNDLGRELIKSEVVGYLTNRSCITAWRRENPRVADVTVTTPIVVIGQARTGTTILHDLLAQDPAHRVPLSWEVDRPCPPPETATYETDPRIAEVEAVQEMVDLVIPGFRSMHPVGARLAQECVRITGGAFRSMIFPTQFRVPSYANWLLHEADMASAYRWHRTYLQHLSSRHAGERWVLKSPGHIWCLEALLAEYPDAILIQTHRDPLKIIASVSSLMSLLRRLGCDDPSMPECAKEFSEYILLGLDRSVDARENGVVPKDRVIDVQFADFMSDQIGCVKAIYRELGMSFTYEAEQRMRTFFAENPANKHGAHRYRFSDTLLDVGETRERALRYQEYFDVPSEAS